MTERTKGDPGSYLATHKRIQRQRGWADHFACVDCGGKALDWSYTHSGKDERMHTSKQYSHVYIRPYSTDIYEYEPRCRGCHKRFDREKGEW